MKIQPDNVSFHIAIPELLLAVRRCEKSSSLLTTRCNYKVTLPKISVYSGFIFLSSASCLIC